MVFGISTYEYTHSRYRSQQILKTWQTKQNVYERFSGFGGGIGYVKNKGFWQRNKLIFLCEIPNLRDWGP